MFFLKYEHWKMWEKCKLRKFNAAKSRVSAISTFNFITFSKIQSSFTIIQWSFILISINIFDFSSVLYIYEYSKHVFSKGKHKY